MFFSGRPEGRFRSKIIIGENSPRCAFTYIPISTHAEIDALRKLRIRAVKNRKIMEVNMMIVRISKTGLVNNATPCHHCLKQLVEASYVKIRYIYYSINPNQIICQKFSDLVNSPNQFISSGYRHRMKIADKKH